MENGNKPLLHRFDQLRKNGSGGEEIEGEGRGEGKCGEGES